MVWRHFAGNASTLAAKELQRNLGIGGLRLHDSEIWGVSALWGRVVAPKRDSGSSSFWNGSAEESKDKKFCLFGDSAG